MALNKEDKSDVKNAMGKALANKVSKVTKDKSLFRNTAKMKEINRANEMMKNHPDMKDFYKKLNNR